VHRLLHSQPISLSEAMKKCLILSILMLATGCTTTELETGYKPRLLGSNETERRGFYAAPFSPEAQAAQDAEMQEFDSRRPRPGY
jgi:hypothetical protein